MKMVLGNPRRIEPGLFRVPYLLGRQPIPLGGRRLSSSRVKKPNLFKFAKRFMRNFVIYPETSKADSRE